MAEILIKLRGTIVNGERVYDHPELKKQVLQELEGKRFEEIIKKEHVDKTSKQRGYYFGGIITGTLMKLNQFAGSTQREIDYDYIRKNVCPMVKIHVIDNKPVIEETVEDIGEYNLDQFSLFLEKVLAFLAMEQIFPLSPEEYNLNSYKA